MEKHLVELQFNCPKKWDEMTPKGNGRFCGDCKKVVTDFSKTEIATPTLPQTDGQACGNFYAHQVEKPFNDARDKVIAFYQKINLRFTNAKSFKPIISFLLIVLLVATGCRRHVRGKVKPKHMHRDFNKEQSK